MEVFREKYFPYKYIPPRHTLDSLSYIEGRGPPKYDRYYTLISPDYYILNKFSTFEHQCNSTFEDLLSQAVKCKSGKCDNSRNCVMITIRLGMCDNYSYHACECKCHDKRLGFVDTHPFTTTFKEFDKKVDSLFQENRKIFIDKYNNMEGTPEFLIIQQQHTLNWLKSRITFYQTAMKILYQDDYVYKHVFPSSFFDHQKVPEEVINFIKNSDLYLRHRAIVSALRKNMGHDDTNIVTELEDILVKSESAK